MRQLSRLHHKDLILWRKALDLAVLVHEACVGLPRHENFGLAAQARRAATSIPSNIAEGCARSSKREYIYFLSVARGSLAELETQLILAERLGYLSAAHMSNLQNSVDEVLRILHAVVAGLHRRENVQVLRSS